LLEPCSTGDLPRLEALIAERGLLETHREEPDVHVMLREAATCKQVVILRYSLDKYPTAGLEYTRLPLDAAWNGHTEAYLYLLERNPEIINKTSSEFDERHDHSALLIASQTRNASLLTHLIAKGADLSIGPLAPRWMDRFLHIEWAALLGFEKGVEALIQAGVDSRPTTALNTASSKRNLNMMTMLLDANSDPNRIHNSGRGGAGSSLHEAAEKGHFDAVLLPLEHGADPWLENSRGKTALATTLESLDDVYPEDTPEAALNPRNAAVLAERPKQAILRSEQETGIGIGLGAARPV
jgi:ankyrin repeat protein